MKLYQFYLNKYKYVIQILIYIYICQYIIHICKLQYGTMRIYNIHITKATSVYVAVKNMAFYGNSLRIL